MESLSVSFSLSGESKTTKIPIDVLKLIPYFQPIISGSYLESKGKIDIKIPTSQECVKRYFKHVKSLYDYNQIDEERVKTETKFENEWKFFKDGKCTLTTEELWSRHEDERYHLVETQRKVLNEQKENIKKYPLGMLTLAEYFQDDDTVSILLGQKSKEFSRDEFILLKIDTQLVIIDKYFSSVLKRRLRGTRWEKAEKRRLESNRVYNLLFSFNRNEIRSKANRRPVASKLNTFMTKNQKLAEYIWEYVEHEELADVFEIGQRHLNSFNGCKTWEDLTRFRDRLMPKKTKYDQLPAEMKKKIQSLQKEIAQVRETRMYCEEITCLESRLNLLWREADRYIGKHGEKIHRVFIEK